MNAPTAISEAQSQTLRQRLQDGALALGVQFSEAQIGRLMDYLALLVKWNSVYNLTAVREPDRMVTQHLLDSMAALPFFSGATRVLDVGAGGGLPGIVLAIWAAEAAPGMKISLIDTVHKKTAFLNQVKVELGLRNVTVITGRVEQLKTGELFDVITSRAFADLRDFINWSQHLLAPGGHFLAMKGQLPDAEIAQLPPGFVLSRSLPLAVPGMDAERHLLVLERMAA